MSSFPKAPEEIVEVFQGFIEACKEQNKIPCDFQWRPCIPQPDKGKMFYGGQMKVPQEQINHYDHMTSFSDENKNRNPMIIQGSKYSLSGY